MLLESRGYVGTRDDLVTEYPTRATVEVNWPDRKDVREQWMDEGYLRLINTAAPESGMIQYCHKGCTVALNSRYAAEMIDILRCQPLPAYEELEMLKAIRGTQWGFDQSIYLFNYGLMVGKHIERKRQLARETHKKNAPSAVATSD